MSDPIGHDPDPDRAALDELRRAFGLDDPVEDDLGATGKVPIQFEIVEQDPLPQSPPPAPPGPDLDATRPHVPESRGVPGGETAAAIETETETAPAADQPAPRVIKIDDFGGSFDAAVADAIAAGPATDTHADRAERAIAEVPTVTDADRPVIAIGADDLPDAVYVEGDLGPGGNTIVFIEDDPDSDALTPESDRDLRRGIEPRLRERRVQVKRAQSRKRLKWVVAAVLVVVLAVGALATFGSSLFAVRADEVTVTGAIYTDPDRLAAVVEDLVGTPVLRADTQRLEAELESIPWVEHAKVTVHFPHGATIDIAERAAVATYQGPDQRFRVLDRAGRVLDVLDKYPFAYVLLAGQDAPDLEPGDVAPQGYVGAAELAKNLTGTVRGRVETLEVNADGSRLVMWLDDGSEVYFGEASDLFRKLVLLETVLRLEPDREPGPIDVSTSQTTS